MCRSETGARIQRVAALCCLLGNLSFAARGQLTDPSWKRVAGTSIAEDFAAPAGGRIASVWYAGGGSRLLVRTAGSGRIFETSDFEHWRLNTTDPALPPVTVQAAGTRTYSAGRDNIYASDDGGQTWVNLTGFNDRSVVGGGFTALAVSPANPREIAAANAFGVWRSLDGGLSWTGLNDGLPNLGARKLLGRRLLALADSSVLSAESGVWRHSAAIDSEILLRSALAVRLSSPVTAATQAGSLVYAGTPDGRVVVSHDSGARWGEFSKAAGVPVERIWTDPERPDSALAAVGARLLRTVNGGLFWDDVTGSLPSTRIRGIAADRSAGIVYVATDRGVFTGSVPLNDAGPASPTWTSISAGLPASVAWDVRLNADGTLTVALDGYGVFETPAPHHTRNIRIVNGADLSDRAAAPGSIISVPGAAVLEGRNGAVEFPVIASSDRSSQLQVPFEATAGVVQLALEGAQGRWTAPLSVKEASPAIFVDQEGAPLVVDSASGLALDPQVAVRAGSEIAVLATGLGKVTPDWPTGVAAPVDSPPAVRGVVTAFVDDAPAEVLKAVLAPGYIGYYLVELRIPQIVNRGAAELRIVMNGEESNRVRLFLEPEALN